MKNNKDNLIKKTQEIFFEKYGCDPDVLSISPGRVNIIGEHVDYNLGLSMPVAIDRYLCVAVSRNNTQTINAYSENLNDYFSVKLHGSSRLKLWQKYVYGSILEALSATSSNAGMNVVINSDIPMGKGISSSAALELSLVCSTLKLFNVKMNNHDIIDMCQRVDHNYVGIKSGKLDQSACLLSKKDSIFIIDFADFSVSYIPMHLKDVSWILIDSKVKRELASSKYHKRVQQCQDAFRLLSDEIDNLNNFRDINESSYEAVNILPPKLKKRVLHILTENNRVLSLKDAIIGGQVSTIGSILHESHKSLRWSYEVSCKEIDFMIDTSEKLEYWYGGRIMGGGFGGSTINLIKSGYEDMYIDTISKLYKREFDIDCESMEISFVDGVKTIDNLRAN